MNDSPPSGSLVLALEHASEVLFGLLVTITGH